ncbi:hypothetical protein F5I97DRAFT_1860673 [Phlebopus sp. FC_14]|nr:hypothetical protein F5I97DRAFT_1860673 [Phlebopus sp. FC_14]
MSDPYVSRKVVNASYRPHNSLMSPGLIRARAPFRVRNAITGLILAAFGVGIWAYSISAVKQDDFADIDEEAKEMMKGRTAALAGLDSSAAVGPGASVSRANANYAAGASVVPETASGPPPPPPSSSASKPRGVLAPVLDRTFPRLLDPTRKTLIWGAPPVDNVGKMQLRSSSDGQR